MVRLELDGGVCITSSGGKLVSACVGSSVERTLDGGLKEGSGVDVTVNMLHRHVSIDDSLLLYSCNLFSILGKEMAMAALMKGAVSVVFESAF